MLITPATPYRLEVLPDGNEILYIGDACKTNAYMSRQIPLPASTGTRLIRIRSQDLFSTDFGHIGAFATVHPVSIGITLHPLYTAAGILPGIPATNQKQRTIL